MIAVSYFLHIVSIPWVCAILLSLSVRLHIPLEFSILVATTSSSRFPTLFVSLGGCPKCTSFGLSVLKEFVSFVRLLEFKSLTILDKTLSILSSSIHGDAVFLLLIGDCWTIVSSLSASSTSLRTLKLSSTLQIFLFTIGVPILPWSILLFPVSLDVRMILLLLSVDSSCDAIRNFWDL